MNCRILLPLAIFAHCGAASLARNFSLPKPLGKYAVGKTQFFLDHTTNNDPIAPPNWNHTTPFVLVSAYYPTEEACEPNSTLRWMDDVLAGIIEQGWGVPPGLLERIYTQVRWQPSPLSPVPDSQPLPTVLLSPGAGGPCSIYTILSSDLASRGYTVLCIDHPGEPSYLAFPPGSSEPGVYGRDIKNLGYGEPLVNKVIGIRIADAQALLKAWPSRAEENGLPGDASTFVSVGHSLGGPVLAGLMVENREVLGGINMDGTFYAVAHEDLRRPYLLLASEGHNSSSDPTWKTWENAQSGWWEELTVNGTVHLNYCDYGYLVDMLGLPKDGLAGPIPADRIRVIETRFVEAFFAKLEGKGGHLLKAKFPSEAWPELTRVNASWLS